MTGVKDGLLAGLELPPDYTVSEWADTHVILSPELASEPGRWRTDRAAYQRGMLDALIDPGYDIVVLKSSAQIGKTSILLVGIGYHIHHAPAPMLMIQPTLEMAEAFSKDKLQPMLRDTPALAERVEPEKSRYAGNTIKHKSFPGGFLTITGANSPTSLRMRSVKIVWADEVDAYPVSAGEEGDPVRLAYKRTQTFWDSKLVMSSTPTREGMSRIDSWFKRSDQRYFYVPCPECETAQRLVWEHVVWDRGRPDTARYGCPHCGSLLTDGDIKRMVRQGEWRAEDPAPNGRIAGFHIWQIYSPWSSLAEIVEGYEASEKLPSERQVWWNTTLGEAWSGEELTPCSAAELLSRAREYPAARVPDEACVLTAGVDVQGDRIEVLFKAYGADNQQWVLDHLKIYGDPSSDAPWQELSEVLSVGLPHASGRTLGVEAAAVDSGYLTSKVYDWCARHIAAGRRWYAIKGVAGEGKIAWERSKVKLKNGARLYNVGVDGLKAEIYSRLANSTPGADYIHFPKREPFTLEWFEQLTAERLITVYDGRGYPRKEWHKPEHRRNEALDINVYADAAHKSLNINHRDRLAHLYGARKKYDAAEIARMFGAA